MTMVISGLWHGAGWTFITWGALHGLGCILTREFERSRFYKDKVPKVLKQLLVFVFVAFAWIFFRASTFSQAQLIVTRIFTSGLSDPAFPLLIAILVLSVWAYQFIYESRARQILQLAPLRIIAVVSMVVYLVFCTSSGQEPFIYLQF